MSPSKALLARPISLARKPKVSVDVGTLCNLGRALSVHATNDVDALLALEPDCVVLQSGAAAPARRCQHRHQSEFMTGINLADADCAAIATAMSEPGIRPDDRHLQWHIHVRKASMNRIR